MDGAVDGENEKVGNRGSVAFGLQAARRAHAEQFSHDPSQVVRGGGDQVAFTHVHDFFQPAASHAARITDVGERPLHALATPALKLSVLAAL